MSTEPYGFLTVAGRAAEAAALATGTALEVSHIAWGSGDRAITGGETALQAETGRAAVHASGIESGQLNVAFFRHQFAAEDGPFIIREAGLFSPAGALLAIVTYPVPISKPVGFALTFDILVAFSDLANLVVRVESAEAFVPAERLIGTGAGLSGGGDLNQDRTLRLDYSALAGLAAAGIHATDDKVAIWDASASAFKVVTPDGLAQFVTASSRFSTAFAAASLAAGRWILTSADRLAAAGERIAFNVSGGARVLTLPAAPVAGDIVTVAVIDGDVEAHNLTINGNGAPVQGDATLVVDVALATVPLVFNGTQWRIA